MSRVAAHMIIFYRGLIDMGFPGGSVVKNPPGKQEMRVRSLGQKDPLEKEMATHSSILAWETLRTESLAGCNPWGVQRNQTQLTD